MVNTVVRCMFTSCKCRLNNINARVFVFYKSYNVLLMSTLFTKTADRH